MKKTVIAPLILLMAVFFAWFFYSNSLTYKIQKNAFAKKCTVNIAVIKDGRVWTANNKKVPLMSVFKYFVALKVLDKIEKEILSLEEMPYRFPERKTGAYANKGYRQLFVGNYTVIYRIDEKRRQVIVITIRYSPSQF